MTRLFLFVIALIPWRFCFAQPGAVDLSFAPGSSTNGLLRDVVIQSDGKIVIGGAFTAFNGTFAGNIARLNPDGSLDTTFHTGAGMNGGVWSLLLQPDGKIIAGGDFTQFDSFSSPRIVRLNADGSRDTSFQIGTGFNNNVAELALQSNGKIIAGGDFTEYDGASPMRLTRLNSDGSIDSGFNSVNGANGPVSTIAIQPDGKILIGGFFTIYQSGFGLRIVRVNADGSRDSGFNSIIGASSAVGAIYVETGGTILVGGEFVEYQFQPHNRIMRLLPDGNLGTFNELQGFDNPVQDILVVNGTDILVAGWFETYQAQLANRLIMLNSDGSIESSFQTGTGADGFLYSLAVQDDGKIIVVGTYTYFNGVYRPNIVRLYNCLTSQPGAITGNDSVLCTQTLVYSVAPVADAESYEWTLPAGWTFNSDSTVNSITVISNGAGGVISVRAFNDSCGFSIPQTKTIYRNEPPVVPVCLVTVDDSSTHNILLWEKPADKSLIDSFFIYRETTTSVYTKIGAIHRDSLSEFHDYGADPNATSYRYKLSVLDTCGAESAQSPFHNTIHLQNLGSGNFQWTFYQIEGSTNPVTEFNIYRDNLGNGNFQQIGLMPGTNSTFTDVSYFAFPDANYVVDVNWSISCTPQRGTVNTTRSNIRGARKTDTLTGINPVIPDFAVYPNPADDIITLRCSFPQSIQRLQLLNMLGQPVWSEAPVLLNSNREKIIDAGIFPKGVYFLSIETSAGRMKRKVVIR